MCGISRVRSLADGQGCASMRDRIIAPVNDEYDSCPLSSGTPGRRHGSYGTGHHGRPCDRASYVRIDHRYPELAMAVLYDDSSSTVFDCVCNPVLEECDRAN
ncbi:hypothetical protein D3C73_1341530 [compost metagenome]